MNATITSGYARLDRIVPDWSNARIVIVAGRPALGKTAFVVSLARNFAIDQRMQIAFFSMKESERVLKNRFMSNICELDISKINDNTLNEEEKAKYKMGLEKFNDCPIFIEGSSRMSVSDFSSKARHAVFDLGARMIFVDYLQLMNCGKEIVSKRRKEISSITHSIRDVAEELDVPIFVNIYLPHRKRYSRNVPCMADIERVGNIERESDVILLLHRPEFYGFAGDMPKNKGIAEIIVIKNIYGKKGSFLLGFIPEFSRFYNLV